MGMERFFKDKSYPLLGKILFLEIMALALCSSFVLSIFTPLPLSLIFLIHGRAQGFLMGILGVLFFILMGTLAIFDGQNFFIGTFLFSFLMALVISEIVRKNIHPLKGFMKGGILFSGALLMMLAIVSFSYPGGITGIAQKSIAELSLKIRENQEKHASFKGIEYKEMMDLLAKPDALAKDFVRSIPLTLILSVFFTLWVNLYLGIKSYRMLQMNLSSPYYFTEKELLHYTVPEIFVWPFIVILVVLLMGEAVVGPDLFFVIKNLLFVFGLFYFIQGLGIFIDLLSLFKIVGPFRSFLVILTIMTSYYMLAALGLFDMWIDFRKFFRKRLNK